MTMKKKLLTEKTPRNPVGKNYRPADSTPYEVKDNDTWINVAGRNGLDPHVLIHFNFKTVDPGEVNWYLRENTGCNVHTKDEKNWMFSDSASPGIIYLPIRKQTRKPIANKGPNTTRKPISPPAMEFEGPSSTLDKLGKVFDGFQLLDMALAVMGVEAGAILLGIGVVLAPAGPFVLMGGMHEAALNELRKQQIKAGLTRGIVMAADGRSGPYITSLGFVERNPIRNDVYPEYGKQLQGIYNTSLVAGIVHGKQFSPQATQNLFTYLHSRMPIELQARFTRYDTADYEDPRDAPENWPTSKWYEYYRICARLLEPKIMLR